MEINFRTCSVEELWKFVASHLERNGFDVVLVGGAVVSIYSEGAYESGDLDFVVNSFNKKELPKVLAQIGFVKTPQRYFKHPDCDHLFLEFPAGPVEVQGSPVEPDEISFEGTKIKILSPTDSAIDRLEQFLVDEYGKPHGERKLFEQAVLIGRRQPVNLKKIEDFLARMRKHDLFQEYLSYTKAPP